MYVVYKPRKQILWRITKKQYRQLSCEKNEQGAAPQGCSGAPLYCKYYPMSREINCHYEKLQPSVTITRENGRKGGNKGNTGTFIAKVRPLGCGTQTHDK